MADSNLILAFLVLIPRVSAGVRLIISDLELLIDEIPPAILPLGVRILDSLEKDPGAILMVEVVLLEGEHLALELFLQVPSLEVLLQVKEVFDVLIEDVDCSVLLLDYLVDLVGVEVGLSRGVLLVEQLLHILVASTPLPHLGLLHHQNYSCTTKHQHRTPLLQLYKQMELGNFSNLEGDQARSVKELEEWLKKGGARFDCLKVVNFREGYRGVIATRDIQKKERLVSIPRSQLMTLEQARMSKIWQQAGTQEFVSPKHTCLAVFLLEQSRLRDLSQWWNYISILPEDHSSFPINYSTQQLTELLGSPLLLQIHQKVVDLKTDYDRLALASPLFSSYSFKEFCWGRTMVGSRMFGVYIDGVKTNILAPFADMLNHRLPKQTVWNYLQNEDSFIIQSLGDLPAGCEVFDSYGRKCNSRYLLNYGFVVLDNPQNQICLRLNIAGALKEKKLQMLKRAEFVKILRISKNLNDNNFYEAMGFLRFATINNPNHLAVLEKISGIHHNQEPYLPAKTPPINVELQIEVWKALGTLCLDNLSEYPRSLQEDEERLQQSSLSNNMRNILTIIIGEKRLSKFYISLCKEVVKVLEQGYVSAFHQIVANPQEPWANYLFKILSIMPNERKKEVMHLTLQTAAEQVETLGEQEQLEP